jgi:hypothetical protein
MAASWKNLAWSITWNQSKETGPNKTPSDEKSTE